MLLPIAQGTTVICIAVILTVLAVFIYKIWRIYHKVESESVENGISLV